MRKKSYKCLNDFLGPYHNLYLKNNNSLFSSHFGITGTPHIHSSHESKKNGVIVFSGHTLINLTQRECPVGVSGRKHVGWNAEYCVVLVFNIISVMFIKNLFQPQNHETTLICQIDVQSFTVINMSYHIMSGGYFDKI